MITGERIQPNQVEEIIADPKQVILVLKDINKRIIGCVQLKNQNEFAYLGMLSVAVTVQAKGIGAQILKAAEEFVKSDWKLGKIKMWY